MKHIKKFYESKSKIELDIEDMLIGFLDSGDLIEVRPVKYDTTVQVNLDFRDSLVGLDRLKVLDRIVTRLKRKYKNVLINDNRLWIDMNDPGNDTILKRLYINGSLLDELTDFLTMKISELHILPSIAKPEYRYFSTTDSEKNIEFLYMGDDKELIVLYGGFADKCANKYMLRLHDIKKIVQDMFVDIYALDIEGTRFVNIINDIFVHKIG